MSRNRYKLVSGFWSRWEGDKATGTRAKYSTAEGSNIVENVTAGELAVMGKHLELIAGKSAVGVPAIEDEAPKVNEGDEPTTWAEVLSANMRDVVASVNVIEDLDDLNALRKEEKKGLNRKGVFTAIEERKEALKAEE